MAGEDSKLEGTCSKLAGTHFMTEKIIPMKIQEFKRSGIGIIAESRGILSKFPNQAGRETLDPDLLGEMVKIEQGSNLLDQIFNLIARYVRKVHSDEHICRVILYSAGRSFLDIIGLSDITYIVSMIKNSKGMWDQDIQVQELGAEALVKSREEIETIVHKWKWPEENSR